MASPNNGFRAFSNPAFAASEGALTPVSASRLHPVLGQSSVQTPAPVPTVSDPASPDSQEDAEELRSPSLGLVMDSLGPRLSAELLVALQGQVAEALRSQLPPGWHISGTQPATTDMPAPAFHGASSSSAGGPVPASAAGGSLPWSAPSSGPAAAQAAARRIASGVVAGESTLASVNNANMERVVPGSTAAAKEFLAGVSSVPEAAVAATSLPGGLGTPLDLTCATALPELPTFASVSVRSRGSFGMDRSATPFLVEHFVIGSSSSSSSLPVSTVFDRSSGVAVSRVSEVKFATDAKLKELFPSFIVFERAHSFMLSTAVRLTYILPSELDGYASFMAQLQRVLDVFNPLPGGWLAFLRFDRLCRMYQFNTGVSWDQAVDMFEFNKALIQLLLPASKPTRPEKFQASPSSKPVCCFRFNKHGACHLGAACPYAAGHVCSKCGAADHGAGQCAAGQQAA